MNKRLRPLEAGVRRPRIDARTVQPGPAQGFAFDDFDHPCLPVEGEREQCEGAQAPGRDGACAGVRTWRAPSGRGVTRRRGYAATGAGVVGVTGAGPETSLGSARQRSRAVTRRWGMRGSTLER